MSSDCLPTISFKFYQNLVSDGRVELEGPQARGRRGSLWCGLGHRGGVPGPRLGQLDPSPDQPLPRGRRGLCCVAIAYALGVWLADAGMHLVAGKGFVVEDTAAAAGPSAKISPVAPKSAPEETKGDSDAGPTGSPI